MYGPQAAFFAELFPTRIRYSGISLGQQIGGVLGSSLAPIIVVALLDVGSYWLVTAYVVAIAALTAVSVLRLPRWSTVDCLAFLVRMLPQRFFAPLSLRFVAFTTATSLVRTGSPTPREPPTTPRRVERIDRFRRSVPVGAPSGRVSR
ncbi:hypothetical protein [Sciscionella sediminilitoris]|uniref:hypothetical protein n=1 Tax=Sciscionella sediminilitoris TaxID=1445613 RepID=UPI0004DF1E58|nr:hypothetical protein [Sciscionella sp. SE31]